MRLGLAFAALLVCAGALTACGPPSVNDSCGKPITCGSGRDYRLCTSGHVTGAYYVASDGTCFPCVSASDCGQATNQAISWCGGEPIPMPDGGIHLPDGGCPILPSM